MTFHGEQVLLRDGQGGGVDWGFCVKVFALQGFPSLFHAEIAHGIMLICGKEAKANRQQSLLFRSKRNMVEMFISLCYTIIRI